MLLFGTAKLWLETMPLCMLVVQCVAALVVPNRCQVRARCPRRSAPPHTARAFRSFFRGCDLLLLLLRLAAARVDGGLGARHLGQRACTLQPAPQPAPQPEPAPQPARAPHPAPASRAHALLAQHATEHATGRIETSAHAPPASPCSSSDSGRPRYRDLSTRSTCLSPFLVLAPTVDGLSTRSTCLTLSLFLLRQWTASLPAPARSTRPLVSYVSANDSHPAVGGLLGRWKIQERHNMDEFLEVLGFGGFTRALLTKAGQEQEILHGEQGTLRIVTNDLRYDLTTHSLNREALTHSLTHSHSHSLALTHSLTHSLTPSLSLTHAHSLTLTPSLSLSDCFSNATFRHVPCLPIYKVSHAHAHPHSHSR